MDLNADHYRTNSHDQECLALQTLALHRFSGDERTLDVGCGDGRITAIIADQLPKGSIEGVDPSANMIELASKSYPKIAFELGCAEELNRGQLYDLITAFSCLHWVRGQEVALERMAAHLRPGGRLLILTYPKEAWDHRQLEAVIESPKWKPYASKAICRHWLTSDQYGEVADRLGFEILYKETTLDIADYTDPEGYKRYALGWLPLLIPLPTRALQEEFLDDFGAHLKQLDDFGSDGFVVPAEKIVLYLEKRK